MSKVIAIHQPNFFPWCGYFDKINKADSFVFLDHVITNITQCWTKRVKLLIGGKAEWFTIPVAKSNGRLLPLNEFLICDDEKFIRKHLNTIKINYSKGESFNEVFPIIEKFYYDDERYISKRNIKFISEICAKLNIEKEFTLSSEMNCKNSSNGLLIEIIKKMDGDIYLCGGGAAGYQDDKKFLDSGIEVKYQNFIHPPYDQVNSKIFVPGLSILDLLMNYGFKKSEMIIKGLMKDK